MVIKVLIEQYWLAGKTCSDFLNFVPFFLQHAIKIAAWIINSEVQSTPMDLFLNHKKGILLNQEDGVTTPPVPNANHEEGVSILLDLTLNPGNQAPFPPTALNHVEQVPAPTEPQGKVFKSTVSYSEP